jgi:integrase
VGLPRTCTALSNARPAFDRSGSDDPDADHRLKHDPSLGIKRPKIRRIRSWTEDEIKTYRARWPLGTKERLAFELFLNTGQRRSDVVRMVWSHIEADNKIVVVQQKTGRRLVIPLHRDLLETLAGEKRAHVSILTTAYSSVLMALQATSIGRAMPTLLTNCLSALSPR